MAAPLTAVEITDLRKLYGTRTVLDGITMSVTAGELSCILGNNGAGKTTLLSSIAGLLMPDSGSVKVLGRDAGYVRTGEIVGLASQEIAIYPTLTVRQNLCYFGRIAGLTGSSLSSRAVDIAEAILLDPLLHRQAGLLSGGEKRRLHVAMAIMHRPRVVLLDEPTAGVDVVSRRHLLDVVRGLAYEGAAVCYSTHYLPEVEALDGTVHVLREGRIAASGTVSSLSSCYGHSSLVLRFHRGESVLDLAIDRLKCDSAAKICKREPECLVELVTDEPEAMVGVAIGAIGELVTSLRGVEIIRPDFESAAVALMDPRRETVELHP